MRSEVTGKKTLLVVGGTSSLAAPILNMSKEKGYSVTATSRQTIKFNSEGVNWLDLDLGLANEPDEFINKIKNTRFNVIIFLIGETSLNFDDKNEYLNLHFAKTLNLLESLRDCLDSSVASCLIYVSSRAAIHASFDPYYSAVKGGMVSAIRSLALRNLSNQYCISIVPGLVIDSKMYNEMPEHLQMSHAKRADNNLLTKPGFAREVFEIIDNLESVKNGEYVTIGKNYE
jgi:short-subunit dehydrogenase involved in D-alanine esterification of teichoic acids